MARRAQLEPELRELPAAATGHDGHPYFCQVHPVPHACTTDAMRAGLVSIEIDAAAADLLAACRACLKARTWPTLEYLPETPTGPFRPLAWPKALKGCTGRLYVGPKDLNPDPPEPRGAVYDPAGMEGPTGPHGPADPWPAEGLYCALPVPDRRAAQRAAYDAWEACRPAYLARTPDPLADRMDAKGAHELAAHLRGRRPVGVA